MSGQGRILSICDVESPPAYPIISHMNYPDDMVSRVLASLNWATADKEYTPSKQQIICLREFDLTVTPQLYLLQSRNLAYSDPNDRSLVY